MTFSDLHEELFFKTLRIRLIEEKVIDLYPEDKIQSPVHLSIGQEAVATGICQILRPKDLIFATYRGHAFYLAKGGNLKLFFAELYGKKSGICEGKAGSMHLAAPEVGMMGSSAIVASTIPHAVGAALAAKKLNKDQIIISDFGDGATDEGIFHESLNFAALHQLPVIFLLENNNLAVHTKIETRQSFNIIDLVKQYNGLETTFCAKGYDPFEVYQSFKGVVKNLITSHLPQFLEITTYRYKEHVGVNEDHDAGYRKLEDLKAWQSKDPLLNNSSLVEKFTPIINEEIKEAVDFAENSPWPTQKDLLTDVI